MPRSHCGERPFSHGLRLHRDLRLLWMEVDDGGWSSQRVRVDLCLAGVR